MRAFCAYFVENVSDASSRHLGVHTVVEQRVIRHASAYAESLLGIAFEQRLSVGTQRHLPLLATLARQCNDGRWIKPDIAHSQINQLLHPCTCVVESA